MLECQNISKRYNDRKVNKCISIKFPETGLISITGPSGCGKTTLLHILGGIKKEYSGKVLYNGKDIRLFRTHYRRHAAFIFQDIYLIMWLNIKNNISLSRYFYAGHFDILQLKEDFHVSRMLHLSLGQRQKVSFLRAAYTNASILLCDEPTGSLDEKSAEELMNQLKQLSKSRLIIMVSHDSHLVKAYSDEIYMMKDGEIINHEYISSADTEIKQSDKHYQYPLSLIQMTYHSLKSHYKRALSMISGLFITLLCILLTLTLTSGLEKEIYDYIYSIVPPSCISFKLKNNNSIDYNIVTQLNENKGVERTQLFLNNYELLGIGFNKERYKENETLFISSDSDPYSHLSLKEGRFPMEDHEIVLSLSTAKKLNSDISQLINKDIYGWYKHDHKVLPIQYKIVGISDLNTANDTFYQSENAYISLLKENYASNNDFNANLGLIYIDPSLDRETFYNQFSKDYKDYEFIKVGESTYNKVSETIDYIEIILLSFTILSVLSCLLLISEITYLNITQQKKDFIIMKCFGASQLHIIFIICLEVLIVFITSSLLSVGTCLSLIKLISIFIKDYLFTDINLYLNPSIIYRTLSAGLIIIIISMIPSVLSLNKIDSQSLKE